MNPCSRWSRRRTQVDALSDAVGVEAQPRPGRDLTNTKSARADVTTDVVRVVGLVLSGGRGVLGEDGVTEPRREALDLSGDSGRDVVL